jgi:non-heme chloroperoxidase
VGVPDDPTCRTRPSLHRYDLRGAGRSDQPGHGYDPDTLADDLAAVIRQLDLQQVTLVGHSMGSAQIVRYLARHPADRDRVARAVFVATTLPFLRKTDDNPDGVDGAVFEETLAAVAEDRPRFAAGVAVSPELQQWLIGLFLQASPRAATEMFRMFTHTDYRADLAAVKVPTLIVHGDSDAMIPFQVSARRTAAAIPDNQLKLYDNASPAYSSPTGNT